MKSRIFLPNGTRNAITFEYRSISDINQIYPEIEGNQDIIFIFTNNFTWILTKLYYITINAILHLNNVNPQMSNQAAMK